MRFLFDGVRIAVAGRGCGHFKVGRELSVGGWAHFLLIVKKVYEKGYGINNLGGINGRGYQ